MLDLKGTIQDLTQNIDPVQSLSREQRTDLSEKTNSFLLILLSFVLFAFPLFFLPTQVDWFDQPKTVFILLASLLALTFWFLQATLAKKLLFSKSIFFLPALLFVAAAVASALLATNKVASLTADPLIYGSCFLIFVIISQISASAKSLTGLIKALAFSAALLSLLSIVQNLIVIIPSLKSTVTLVFLNPSFSPAGSLLSQAIFLALALPLAAGLYFHSLKTTPSVLASTLMVIIFLGLAASVFALFQQRPVLLPQNTGWRIATSSLGDSLQTAFLGVGPTNFIDAFTANKGSDFNSSLYWNLRFTTSSNFYFYLLTSVGIAGLAAFLFLAWKLVSVARRRLEVGPTSSIEKGLLAALIIALVLFALLPAPTTVLVIFFALLGMLAGFYRSQGNATISADPTDLSARNGLLPLGGVLVALIVLGLAGFNLTKFVLADYNFANSLIAAAANRGTDTYNLQIVANTLNPWNDNYHLAYSQTNLALANTLAGQPNLTDQQKQTVVALVQQAIREGRIAVSLSPKRAGNWENLSLIYRNLINFAQGADQWAILAENQAITLDPASPRLRLDLGGIYFAAKDYQTAGQNFATAVTLKPDYANAHYNLAQAMKLLGLKDQATQQLQLTASLVCATPPAGGQTTDCQKVNDEIAAFGATPSATASATATGSAQSKLATPGGQTNLPKAATKPPASISSPSGELAQ